MEFSFRTTFLDDKAVFESLRVRRAPSVGVRVDIAIGQMAETGSQAS